MNQERKYRLEKNIYKLSTVSSLEELPNEWVFISNQRDDTKNTLCICNHKIKLINVYMNSKTGHFINVGDTCEKHLRIHKSNNNGRTTLFYDIVRELHGEYGNILDAIKYSEDVRNKIISSVEKLNICNATLYKLKYWSDNINYIIEVYDTLGQTNKTDSFKTILNRITTMIEEIERQNKEKEMLKLQKEQERIEEIEEIERRNKEIEIWELQKEQNMIKNAEETIERLKSEENSKRLQRESEKERIHMYKEHDKKTRRIQQNKIFIDTLCFCGDNPPDRNKIDVNGKRLQSKKNTKVLFCSTCRKFKRTFDYNKI